MVNSRSAFCSTRPRLFDVLDCETEIGALRRLHEKIETARCTEPLKKRDCESREIQLTLVKKCENGEKQHVNHTEASRNSATNANSLELISAHCGTDERVVKRKFNVPVMDHEENTFHKISLTMM